MAKPVLRVTSKLGNQPTAWKCSVCPQMYYLPSGRKPNEEKAAQVRAEFEHHVRAKHCENFSQADAEQLAGELRKHADETRKRAKPGEDASQAAARIVKEATQD